jgi:hypothetical protein
MHDDFMTEYDRAFYEADKSRLGGTMQDEQERPSPYLVATVTTVAAIHIFSDRIVYITKEGGVTTIDRYNGQLRTA